MAQWTFITRQAVALGLICSQPRITAREMGEKMGITERAVRNMIADLYEGGYIKKKREGRNIKYRINTSLPLRQEDHRDIEVGDLLTALGFNNNHNSKTQI